MSNYEEVQRALEGQKAKINYECASSVMEIDMFKDNLIVLQQFVYEDKEMAARFTEKLMQSPIVNYSLSISPFLLETRDKVSEFISQYNDEYDLNRDETIRQALFNVAANNQISSLVELCDAQVDEISRMRE